MLLSSSGGGGSSGVRPQSILLIITEFSLARPRPCTGQGSALPSTERLLLPSQSGMGGGVAASPAIV